jgi:DNA-binding MarR family transcriptional regulator
MKSMGSSLQFFLNLAKIQAVMTRRFDGSLGGLSLSEFLILLHLDSAPDQKLRRVDLAEKIGLTASGVTRLLLPMEKIGLIMKELNARDARVSFVRIASGGQRQLSESLERAELLAGEIIPAAKAKKIEAFSGLLSELGGTWK